jgi:hypothetical protein
MNAIAINIYNSLLDIVELIGLGLMKNRGRCLALLVELNNLEYLFPSVFHIINKLLASHCWVNALDVIRIVDIKNIEYDLKIFFV